jgi:hypothetical protein
VSSECVQCRPKSTRSSELKRHHRVRSERSPVPVSIPMTSSSGRRRCAVGPVAHTAATAPCEGDRGPITFPSRRVCARFESLRAQLAATPKVCAMNGRPSIDVEQDHWCPSPHVRPKRRRGVASAVAPARERPAPEVLGRRLEAATGFPLCDGSVSDSTRIVKE